MQTPGHHQLKLALAPLQQVKEKILKMKRQPGMGHKEVLGRASLHPRQRENGGDMGLAGSGGTAEPIALLCIPLPSVRAAGAWDI